MKRILLLLIISTSFLASAQVPDYVPTDGLVAWYPFNGDATDASGNGHDGTVEGAILANDRFSYSNGAYFFDGDDRIFPANPGGYPLQERTTSIWMKSNVPVTGGRTLMGYGGSSCGNSWLLTYNNLGNQPYTSNAFEIQGHCNNNSVAAPLPSIEFTNWHLVIIRTSAAGTDVFIDGVLGEHSSVFIDDTAPGCAVFGGVPSPSGGCYYQDANVSLWNGWLDDIGIWNRALSDDEIVELYNAPPPIAGCTDPNACNHDPAATLDDGSCIPSGCMDDAACNYNEDAQCEGEACDYSCCPGPGCCGGGMHWDAAAQTCVITPPSVAPDAECTLLNLQELAEGYQILLDQVDTQQAEIDLLQQEQNASNPCGAENTLIYAGHEYDIIDIGQQCWFAENLRTTTFNNGDPLLQKLTDAAWNTASGPACAIYGELDSPCQQELSTVQYCGDPTLSLQELGRLYNGHSVTDSRNICPSGWHVAADLDFLVLESFLGMSASEATSTGWRGTNQGTQLKGTSNWYENGNGSDLFGLNIKPSGYRASNGAGHRNVGGLAYFWTSTMGGGELYRRVFSHGQPGIQRLTDSLPLGFAIRCVKN